MKISLKIENVNLTAHQEFYSYNQKFFIYVFFYIKRKVFNKSGASSLELWCMNSKAMCFSLEMNRMMIGLFDILRLIAN